MQFTASNPLFLRLFDVTTRWGRRASFSDRPSEQSSTRTNDPHDIVESLFLDAARELAHELRLPSLGELGTMFDDIIKTNTISKPTTGFWKRRKLNKSSKSDGSSTMLRDSIKPTDADYNVKNKNNRNSKVGRSNYDGNKKDNRFSKNFHMGKKPMKRLPSDYSLSTFNNAIILEEGITPHNDIQRTSQISLPSTHEQNNRGNHGSSRKSNSRPPSATTERLSSQDDVSSEDRHIFLVKRIDKKELSRLLAIGYRFAEATFISRTMGDRLQIPAEHMASHFSDMRYMALSVSMLMQQQAKQQQSYPIRSGTVNSSGFGTSSPRSPSIAESTSENSISSENDTISESATRSTVFLGLSVLVQEDKENNPHNIHIIVDKKRRHAFPMVQLVYEDGEIPSSLEQEERNCILSLHGQSLQNMCSLESHIQLPRESGSTLVGGRQSTDWAASSDAASTLVSSGASPPDFGISPISSANMSSPLSPSSSRGMTSTTRFTRALEISCRKLVEMTSYGKPLANVAKLHGEVVDIPPFGLTLGPCQLILFRAWVTIPGTISAINQTLTEKVKCVPLPLYRSLAYHITDQAVVRYRAVTMRSVPESTYLAQQRVYQSTAAVSQPSAAASKPTPPSSPLARTYNINNSNDDDNNFIHDKNNSDNTSSTPTIAIPSLSGHNEMNDINYSTSSTTQTTSTNPLSDDSNRMSVLTPLPSLPPPPRTRRPKLQFPAPNGLSLLSLESLADKRTATQRNQNTAPSSTFIELPTILTILPTQDRFWWLNSMIDEIMHGY